MVFPLLVVILHIAAKNEQRTTESGQKNVFVVVGANRHIVGQADGFLAKAFWILSWLLVRSLRLLSISAFCSSISTWARVRSRSLRRATLSASSSWHR